MWDFLIVLGQIPGTNIQITFNELLYSLVFSFIAYMVYKERLQLHHEAVYFSRIAKKEVKQMKRTAKNRRIAGSKLLKAFKRRAKAKVSVKNLRGIPAAKLHTRQKVA